MDLENSTTTSNNILHNMTNNAQNPIQFSTTLPAESRRDTTPINWTNLNLPFTLPTTIKDILEICGYEDPAIICESGNNWISECENFLHKQLAGVSKETMKKYCGSIFIESGKPVVDFQLPPGHKILLDKLKSHNKNVVKSRLKCSTTTEEMVTQNFSKKIRLDVPPATTKGKLSNKSRSDYETEEEKKLKEHMISTLKKRNFPLDLTNQCEIRLLFDEKENEVTTAHIRQRQTNEPSADNLTTGPVA